MSFYSRPGAAVVMGMAMAAVMAAAPDGDWTKADRARVEQAARAAVDGAQNAPAKAAMTIQLAKQFEAEGDTAQAKQQAVRTKTALGADPGMEAVAPLTDAMALLIHLGDPAAAQSLAESGAASVHAALLGALGRLFATAHDAPHVADTIARIRTLPETKASGDDADDARTAALGDIGTAEAENGQVDAALALAKTLPAGGPRLRLQAEIAFALCHDGPSAQGAAVARLAEDAVMHPGAGAGGRISGGATYAAAAAAACMGADAAHAILDAAAQNPAMTRDAAVTLLEDAGLEKAAATLAPPPEAGNAVALAAAAKRRLDAGDRTGAHELAAQAAKAGAATHDQHDQVASLTVTFSVLTGLGAYDEALDAVKPLNLPSRRGFSLNVIHTVIANHDAASVRRMVPRAMALMAIPSPFNNVSRDQLADMALMLAKGGYRDEAETVFKALTPPNDDDDDYFGARYALAKAGLGDVDGAIKMAASSGALVTALDAPAALPGMPAPNAAPAPGGGTTVYRPGPQAEALSAVAAEFAESGQIEAAQRAEAKLEIKLPGPQDDAVAEDRDGALAAIARAQLKAGRPHEALATCMRIVSPGTRFAVLVAMLALPVKS